MFEIIKVEAGMERALRVPSLRVQIPTKSNLFYDATEVNARVRIDLLLGLAFRHLPVFGVLGPLPSLNQGVVKIDKWTLVLGH